jgi:hypothetical protein
MQKELKICDLRLKKINDRCLHLGHDIGGRMNARLAERATKLRENLEDLRKFRDRGWHRRALEMHMLDFDYSPPVYVRDGELINALVEAWESLSPQDLMAILASP